MKIGKAKYGFTTRKYFKLKDGEALYRILPPLGNLADDGRWSVYYSVHYGYKNTTGKPRAFQSPEVTNRQTKMVEVPDAANDRIKKLKAELEKAKTAGNKPMIDKLTQLVGGQKPMYNLDRNHYMNVIDPQGNIGVLKLRHKAKVMLDAQIRKLRESGVDPLSIDNGRFFVFTRSGMGNETSFQVEVAQEKLMVTGVGEVKRDIVHQLSKELIDRLDGEAAELDKLFKALSSEDVARIVNDSDLLTGTSKIVDEIFDTKSNSSASSEEVYEDEDEDVSLTQVVAAASAPTQTITEIPKVVASEVIPAKTESKSVSNVEVLSSPTKTTSQQVSDVSDDEFLKSLGL